MKTFHIEAEEGQIAKTVLMPGDPMRAKCIAEWVSRLWASIPTNCLIPLA